ncbi:MAG: hotdog fold thioesterase [Bacteroidetes bacterium]|nr:hotdog fold thioesterase [Bacteroidota bacterium]
MPLGLLFCSTLNSVFFEAANIRVEDLNLRCEGTMNTALGIRYTELGADYLCAEMPVDERTIQPAGVLNGGASLGLIETLGSMAANLTLNPATHIAVGQSVACNHLRPVFKGASVFAKSRPVHIGSTTQVWEVEISDEQGRRVCKGSITMAVVNKVRLRG